MERCIKNMICQAQSEARYTCERRAYPKPTSSCGWVCVARETEKREGGVGWGGGGGDAETREKPPFPTKRRRRTQSAVRLVQTPQNAPANRLNCSIPLLYARINHTLLCGGLRTPSMPVGVMPTGSISRTKRSTPIDLTRKTPGPSFSVCEVGSLPVPVFADTQAEDKKTQTQETQTHTLCVCKHQRAKYLHPPPPPPPPSSSPNSSQKEIFPSATTRILSENPNVYTLAVPYYTRGPAWGCAVSRTPETISTSTFVALLRNSFVFNEIPKTVFRFLSVFSFSLSVSFFFFGIYNLYG